MFVGLCATAIAVSLTRSTFVAAALTAVLLAGALLLWFLQSPDRWLGLFFFAALLLPPLPIALGDSGPHVALVFAALGLFAGLLRFSAWRIRLDLLSIALVVFFGVLAASVAMAAVYSGLSIAAGSLARVCLFGISVYVFWYTAHGPLGEVRPLGLLYWAGVGSAVFGIVDFYFQFPAPAGFGRQFIWLDSGVFRRAQGFFYEASTLGNLCAFFLLMTVVAICRKREQRPLPGIALLLGGVVFLAALVLSYSRASLLNLGAALLTLFWMERRRIGRARFLALAAVGVAVGSIVTFVVFPAFAAVWWLRLAQSAQYFFEAPEAVLSGRLASWRTLVAFVLNHPWHALLGIGYKTLPYSEFVGSKVIGDNTYLTLLVETGIVGIATLCLLNWAILRAALHAARSADGQRSFYGVWIFCFWIGQLFQMFSADLLTYWRVLPVYLFVLALAVRE